MSVDIHLEAVDLLGAITCREVNGFPGRYALSTRGRLFLSIQGSRAELIDLLDQIGTAVSEAASDA